MKAERVFKFSFINMLRKLCTEFDVNFYNIEILPNNKMKFFFDDDYCQLTAFLTQIDIVYNDFINLNASTKFFSLISS